MSRARRRLPPLLAAIPKWWRRSLTLDSISKIGLLAGGLFAAIQYIDARDDARVNRTMEYIGRYEQGEVAQARRAINATLLPYLPQFKRLGVAAVPKAEKHAMILSIIEASGDPELLNQIDRVVDFYEGLRTCTREGVCSARVANRYFGEVEAPEFWSNFEGYIAQRRENNPAYARGLEWYARSAAPAGFRAAR